MALLGFAKFFKKASGEEREHGTRFMEYQASILDINVILSMTYFKHFIPIQNVRGGRIVLKPIDAPAKQSWDSAVEAVQDAVELEKTVNQVLFWQSIEVDMLFHNYYYQLSITQSLLLLHSGSGEDGDPHLCDFLETHYLDEQVKAVKELSDLLTKMKRAGDGVGLHIIDKELEEKS